MQINVVDLGPMEYKQTLELQENIRALRVNDKIEDTLLIVEHNPVLTIGSSGDTDNILVSESFLREQNIDVVELSRGGNVTYHGPGQIVGYPIFHLKNYNKDVKAFIRNIKETFICLLKEKHQIDAIGLEKNHTGVWVGNDKITAIGLSVSKMVSAHGFAFNINTNLEHFKWINPCGYKDRGVTSLAKLKGYNIDIEQAKRDTIDYFCEMFNVMPNFMSHDELNYILEARQNES